MMNDKDFYGNVSQEFHDAVMSALDEVERMEAPKPKRKIKISVTAAAVMAAVLVLATTTVFAKEIKAAIYGFFGSDELISGDIISNIYEDEDEHVRFAVEKLVSDNINSYAIVRYTALDDAGREWLGNFVKEEDYLNREGGAFCKLDFIMSPLVKDNNNALYGVNYSFVGYEVTDEMEEDTRVFRLNCNSSGENTGTYCVELSYPMPGGGSRTTGLDVSESVSLRDIKLDSSKAPAKSYIPTGVKLSPLGIFVYGNNNGLYGYDIFEDQYSIWSTSDDSCEVSLVRKDGTVMDDLGGWSLSADLNPLTDYDVCVYAAGFKEPVDTDSLSGINIDGVFYSFE